MADIVEIADEQMWDEKVDNAKGTELVEFYVTWCPHCQREAPILDSLADDIRALGVEVYRGNAEGPLWVKGDVYGISETPSFLLIQDGQLVQKHEGFLEPDEIIAFAKGESVEYMPDGQRLSSALGQ